MVRRNSVLTFLHNKDGFEKKGKESSELTIFRIDNNTKKKTSVSVFHTIITDLETRGS